MNTFNDKDAAALYSQLTGVLAGFAFAALMMLVTTRGSSDRNAEPSHHYSRSLALLLSAFFGLVSVSLAYALVGGDESFPRAAMGHVVAGAGFGISALALLLAILYVVSEVDPGLAPYLQFVAARMGPMTVAIYLVSGAIDVERQMSGKEGSRLWPFGVALVGVVISALTFGSTFRDRFADEAWHTKAAIWFSKATLVVSLLCSLGVPLTLALVSPDDAPLSAVWLATTLGIGPCALVAASSPAAGLVARLAVERNEPVDETVSQATPEEQA